MQQLPKHLWSLEAACLAGWLAGRVWDHRMDDCMWHLAESIRRKCACSPACQPPPRPGCNQPHLALAEYHERFFVAPYQAAGWDKKKALAMFRGSCHPTINAAERKSSRIAVRAQLCTK